MIGFAAYAVLVWYWAFRLRRTWAGFGLVGGGVLGLILLAILHLKLNDWTQGRIFLPVLQVLLYPYTILVLVMGMFIAAMPRYAALACAQCGYNLSGLDLPDVTCPECGKAHVVGHDHAKPCRRCGGELPARTLERRGSAPCPTCGVTYLKPAA